MSKSNPTRPNAPEDEKALRDHDDLPDTSGPVLLDPRSVAAMDNIGVDDQADLLDLELDEQLGDRGPDGHSFADDVRSDSGVNNGEPL
ncbi:MULTISPECIES: hypothetical protein [Luteimonas]|uniref:Uncharacterized protein n=1 Tax=Luteimonas chenhongjianii TaxID=2006110 RepID=A0A290XGF6_9GAMM|nr:MULTISPECIES: hypothetical protein [Luteimonas]ATD68235.1 hypothetical protein CNR27_13000 [Luteimonas chenhongjianii]RPD88089.1 hypothetical protein EGK76_02610 [Luteimonas sp. 100069]